MKVRNAARLLILALLLVSGSIPAVAQEADPCGSGAPIRPGDVVTDGIGDAGAPHIDIVKVSTSMPEWRILNVVFHLRDLPERLEFGRSGVEEDEVEYSWDVLIDLDGDPNTGFRGGFDYLLSASYAVPQSESGADIFAPPGDKVRASTLSLDHQGGTAVLDAKLEYSADEDTITIRGGVPRLTAEARLAFEAVDALAGSDRVGCFPAHGETVTLGGCQSGAGAALPGQSAADEVADTLPAYTDITRVETYHRRGALTVVFHLRALPERLAFNRPGIEEGQLEYAWEVLIDVDNDKETGDRGTDFTLSAFHYIHPSRSGTNVDVPVERGLEAGVWEPTEDGGAKAPADSAGLEVSHEEDTITLYGIIPGLNAGSRLTFGAYDGLEGSDTVGCPPSLSWGESPGPCDVVDVITPGGSATDSAGDVRKTIAADSDQSHIDIIGVSTSLSENRLTVVFHLADVPETLVFDRTEVESGRMEYMWEVSIDVDNDPGTGHAGGYEYLLSATHIVFAVGRGESREAAIEDAVEADVWKVDASSIQTIGWAEAGLEVSADEDTITLSGLVPGITTASRLSFRTEDLLGGSDEIACQSTMQLGLAVAPCGAGEAAVRPNQRVVDDTDDGLPAYIDFVQVSTAVAGETLAVVIRLRELPADIGLEGAGAGDDLPGSGWSVSIDVDPSNESGRLGFDYNLSATYIGIQQSSDSGTAGTADNRLQAYVLERVPDGYTWFGDAAIVASSQADTVTLVGDIPGITADSRLVFEAYALPEHSERILCQALPSEEGAGSAAPAPSEGE